MLQVTPKPRSLRKSQIIAALIAVGIVGAGLPAILHFTAPTPDSSQSAEIQYPRPPRVQPEIIMNRTPLVFSSVHDALVAAGIDEDKASDAANAIERRVTAQNEQIGHQIDDLRFYGEIALGSLVPLWIIALVALFRHQRPPVDLWHLSSIIARAEQVALDHTPDATAPFIRRPR